MQIGHDLSEKDQRVLVQLLADECGWGPVSAIETFELRGSHGENRLKFNALVPVLICEIAVVAHCGGKRRVGLGEWFYWERDDQWELSEFKEEL